MIDSDCILIFTDNYLKSVLPLRIFVADLFMQEIFSKRSFALNCFDRTAEEKRDLVKYIKDSIKRSMKAGSLSVASSQRSSSFRRHNAEDRLNSSDPSPFLRTNNDTAPFFRRSFSHDPEGILRRRSSLESDATHSSVDTTGDTETIVSGTSRERRISLKKKNKAVSPMGLESSQIHII